MSLTREQIEQAAAHITTIVESIMVATMVNLTKSGVTMDDTSSIYFRVMGRIAARRKAWVNLRDFTADEVGRVDDYVAEYTNELNHMAAIMLDLSDVTSAEDAVKHVFEKLKEHGLTLDNADMEEITSIVRGLPDSVSDGPVGVAAPPKKPAAEDEARHKKLAEKSLASLEKHLGL